MAEDSPGVAAAAAAAAASAAAALETIWRAAPPAPARFVFCAAAAPAYAQPCLRSDSLMLGFRGGRAGGAGAGSGRFQRMRSGGQGKLG